MKEWKLINFCEFDKYAIKSYCAIHNANESLNLGDITKVNEKEIADFNLMTWGFPCGDISVAGKQEGFIDEDGNKTRSGMYYEGIRILKEKKPEISIIENVKNLTSKKFKKEFEIILSDLDECGYNTYWKILNAKDYGIPQNRERIFLISLRKDIDNGKFKFPDTIELTVNLKDILEQNVDEKYYINKPYKLIAEDNNQPKILEDFYSNRAVREYENYSPTLRADRFGLKVMGYFSYPNSDKMHQSNTFYDPNGISQTLVTCAGGNTQMKTFIDKRIRKLTPTEYWRLMGFTNDDINKCINIGISNSQLYKQAGNSIVVNVLYYIFKELYIAIPNIFDDLKLSSFFSGIGAFEKALDKMYRELN